MAEWTLERFRGLLAPSAPGDATIPVYSPDRLTKLTRESKAATIVDDMVIDGRR